MSEGRHLSWGAQALWQQLEPLLPGISVEVVAHVDSTSTRLMERLRRADAPQSRPGDLDGVPGPARQGRRAGDTQPALLVAEHQTAGRGRLGRDWHASAGASLTFSLALPLPPGDASGLSLATGLALAEALDPAGDAIALKWPNDLWLRDAAAPAGGRKLGGVLIETVNVGGTRMAVIGVGLNVLPQALPGLSSGYACLQEIDPAASAPAALQRVAAPLVQALLRFGTEGLAPRLPAYAARDLLRGRPVTTTQAGLPEGRALGIDAQGALRVTAPDGSEHRVISGEVSVRPGQGH